MGLARQVHAALTERIAQGKIGPEERLVVERVAAELGVSPTPVREAINRLLQDGLVEDAPNGRLRIVRLTPDYVVNTFMVRAALEGLAAELAAPRVEADHMSALDEAMGKIEAAAKRGEYEVFSSLDDSLHQIIREAAGNPVLSRELRPAPDPHWLDLRVCQPNVFSRAAGGICAAIARGAFRHREGTRGPQTEKSSGSGGAAHSGCR